MAKIRCDQVTDGLRASEVVASFSDYRGRRHFIRVERDFLSSDQGAQFLPVDVVQHDEEHNAVLIELPHEAETGANRLWIKEDQFADLEAFA